jgi:hypothetical protein
VARVFVWSTNTNPNPLDDVDFSVMILAPNGNGGNLAGYATIDGVTPLPAVRNFGGSQTTGVAVSRSGVGVYDVTFTGAYGGVATRDDITVLVTVSDSNNFHVASASMDQGSGNATTIVVRVFVWSTNSNPNPIEDADFSVALLN